MPRLHAKRIELLSRYIAGEESIFHYRQIIENTPLSKPLTVKETMQRMPLLDLSPAQKTELRVRVGKLIRKRNAVRKYSGVPVRRLFFCVLENVSLQSFHHG